MKVLRLALRVLASLAIGSPTALVAMGSSMPAADATVPLGWTMYGGNATSNRFSIFSPGTGLTPLWTNSGISIAVGRKGTCVSISNGVAYTVADNPLGVGTPYLYAVNKNTGAV